MEVCRKYIPLALQSRGTFYKKQPACLIYICLFDHPPIIACFASADQRTTSYQAHVFNKRAVTRYIFKPFEGRCACVVIIVFKTQTYHLSEKY